MRIHRMRNGAEKAYMFTRKIMTPIMDGIKLRIHTLATVKERKIKRSQHTKKKRYENTLLSLGQ
jgi:hypothetical protein